MVIPIVLFALCMVSKDLEEGLEKLEIDGVIETTQTTSLLIRLNIQQKYQKCLGDFSGLAVTQSPMKAQLVNTGVKKKNLGKSKMIIYNRVARVGCTVKEMKQLISNAANWHKRNTRVSMIGWESGLLGIVQKIKIWPC